ncbi:hypothetical protein ACJW30_01G121400 [Castanea mollissima]
MDINKVHVNVMILLLCGAFLLGVLNPKVATAQTDGCPDSCFCMEYMTCGSSD